MPQRYEQRGFFHIFAKFFSMEKFKSGDKVNFLNQKGGGVVRKIIDTRMAEVEIEDGFCIPVLMSELVMDFRAQPDRRQQVVDNVQEEIRNQEIIRQKEENDARIGKLRRFGRKKLCPRRSGSA